MKLWENNKNKPHPLVWEFLTKKDVEIDNIFLPYDIQGTCAHAKALLKAKIITKKEQIKIAQALKNLKNKKQKITPELEDSHTYIEWYLTKNLGNLGKKIQTCRSRNDQALTMIRLYMKDKHKEIEKEVTNLKDIFLLLAKKHSKIKMPGYTHTKKAMPVNVELYWESFADSLNDDLKLFDSVMKILDQSPLGSASGFGLPVEWPKESIATDLGFEKVQTNPIYCQTSRGKFESMFVFCIQMISKTLNKLCSDMMFFTSDELGFFSLPENFLTGSSLMPNKKNYDIFELARATHASITSNTMEINLHGFNLISGYHRDFQKTKQTLVQITQEIISVLKILTLALENLKINKQNLKKALTTDLNATNQAIKMALSGIPFRESYKIVKKKLLF